MNFNDAMLSVELVLQSGSVPLLIGESGIGKTALVYRLCKDSDYHPIVIDANMLKEGEIGGLPTIEDYTAFGDGKEIKRKKTVYAVHTKLLEIDELKSENLNCRILLFIDEINRCEHAVQQELMNIILNRDINGFKLPKDVKIIAAMNPSNKYDKFSETEYQVVDMDPAQEDRFVWIDMESDVESWIAWGLEDTNIHPDVLSFISSYPDYLHTPHSQEMVKATPRSWERVSSSYKAFIAHNKKFSQRIFYNVVKGNVGTGIAAEFCAFIQNSKDTLLKPEKFFSHKSLTSDIEAYVQKESHTRLYLTASNLLRYLNNIDSSDKEIKLFSQFLNLHPYDLRMGIMKTIKDNYGNSLYEKFLDDDIFLDSFFSLIEMIEG
jgi:hypothetical protein